jgi:uncharacterized protein (DUF305 family)
MNVQSKLLLIGALALFASPAMAQQNSIQGDHMSGMGPAHSVADQALMDSMTKMSQAMNAPLTGDPDRDFVTLMIPHHQGAVDMAKVELQYGKDPAMRKMGS